MSEPGDETVRDARYVVRFVESDWPCYELVDTVTGRVVADDGGGPEDRTLYRDFAPLVDELNRVAQTLASERAKVEALVEAARAMSEWGATPRSNDPEEEARQTREQFDRLRAALDAVRAGRA